MDRDRRPAQHRPQRALIVSEAPCASAVFDAAPVADRHGSPICRANCPEPMQARICSGVPKAGEPDFMSTFDRKPP